MRLWGPRGNLPRGLRTQRRDYPSAPARRDRFQTALRRAIHGVLARYPSLAKVTFTLTR